MPLIDMSETYQMTNVGDHIDGTDVYQSNRNLLDNWYFVGGGSQNGDGYFPINQLRATSYAGGACIDRWTSDDGITLYADGVDCPTSAFYQNQDTPFVKTLLGKTLTASVLFADGTLVSGTATLPSSAPATTTFIQYENVYGLSTVLFDNGTAQILRFSTGQKRIAAAKLEVGTVSTLANDPPPKYKDELENCQRYYYRWYSLASAGTIAYVYCNGSTGGWAILNLPVTMHRIVNVYFNSLAIIDTNTGGYVANVTSLQGAVQIGNIFRLDMAFGGNIPAGMYALYLDPNCYLDIDGRI